MGNWKLLKMHWTAATRSKALTAAALALSFAAFFLAAGIYISYNRLKTTEYRVRSEKIGDSVTICLLADLHDHRFGEQNRELVERAAQTEPDLILICGDIINDDSPDPGGAADLMRDLAGIAPVFFSPGNQEKEYMGAEAGSLMKEFAEAGAVVLDEDALSLEIKGNRFCLGGMYEYAFAADGSGHMDKSRMAPDRLAFLEDFQSRDAYKIMVAHRPDSFIFHDAADTWDIDLVLSGHLHGGQVILPFLGGLYAGDQGFFPRYVYGEHHFKGVLTMIITSGLGSDREKLPRFNNIPEVVRIVLEKSGSGQE
jgi:predicted MPP superfamily phosphohydrolase